MSATGEPPGSTGPGFNREGILPCYRRFPNKAKKGSAGRLLLRADPRHAAMPAQAPHLVPDHSPPTTITS